MNNRPIRDKLNQLAEIEKHNSDRALEHAEWLFQLNHIPERYERIKRMNPKPGREAEYAAILVRYEQEIKA